MRIRLPESLRYMNKGLMVLLGTLFLATLGSVCFLVFTLLNLRSILNESGNAVSGVIILQDMQLNLEQAESAQRGYVITGNASYLPDYDKALARIPRDLKVLQTNKNLNIDQADVKELTNLANQRVERLKEVKAIRDSEGFEAAQAEITSGKGTALMDRIKTLNAEIISDKLRGVTPRETNALRHLRQALYIAVALVVFVLGVCGLITWYFQRTILKERSLEGTKNEFLSLASHQLRTPATNVKQYLGLMLDDYMGPITVEQRRALEIAYRNNETEINIMNDLLDVAKLDLNRIQLHREQINLVPLVRQVVNDYKPLLGERGQRIKMSAPRRLPAKVDQEYFKGVVENLIDNAMKYSANNTSVLVTMKKAGNKIRLEVHDHGLGISKRDQAKLFNKFTRLANDYSAVTSGSGLGLYWVKNVVGLHGGTVSVASREGKGSTFTVVLPG